MLEAAREALCGAGVLRPDDAMPPFSVRMSGNLVFLVYPPDGAFYLVKIGLHSDLKREYEGFSAGHAAFPDGVPKPLALSQHRSLPTLVTSGVPFAPLGPLPMQAPSPVLERAMAHYFATAAHAFRVDDGPSHSQCIRNAFESLSPEVASDSWAGYIDDLSGDVDHLPATRQHGDFYVNNLGLYTDALVVLDWEDFGLACLPGFDLALLLLSLNAFSISEIRSNTAEGARHSWILRAGTEGTGLSERLFHRLLPAYLAITAQMKNGRGYEVALRERAIRALLDARDFADGGSGPLEHVARSARQ
jgi:hypothetical protein